MAVQETITLSPEALKARKRRSLYTALALLAFAGLIFAITVAKLGENAAQFSQEHGMEEAIKAQRSETVVIEETAEEASE